MLKNLMEDKRLDFDAPLLSVRRFAAVGAAAAAAAPASQSASGSEKVRPAAGNPPPRRSFLPFYKSDLKSGPIRNPGVVPFVWEQTPGQPKDGPGGGPRRPSVAPKLPPGRILNDKEPGKVTTSVRTLRPMSFSSSDGGKVGTLEGTKTEDVGKKSAEVEVEKKEKVRETRLVPADCCDEEEDDAFSDALDTLSRTESFFMNCSVSGLSGIPDFVEPSGSFWADPQVRDFMMDRFLPAAQAVATSSPQCAPRKPQAQAREATRLVERAESGDHHQRRIPLSYQYGATKFVAQHVGDQEEEGENYDDEDEEEDYYDNGHSSSKACGLLPRFCLNSSFCLLNPVPGMKVQSRLPPPHGRRIRSPQIEVSHNGSLGQVVEEHSWEAVYKHKLGNKVHSQGEEGSKMTSESNRLTNSSDSQTPNGSSPYRRSMGSAILPYRNEPSQSPFHEGKGFLGVPKRESKDIKTDGSDSFERDGENYWIITPPKESQQGSGSMSPAVDRTLYVDSVHVSETPNSKSSSVDFAADVKGIVRSVDENSEVQVERRKMKESHVVETCDRDVIQPKVSEIVEPGLATCSERSAYGEMHKENGVKCNDKNVGLLSLKADQSKDGAKTSSSILPPPLPQSPSESWLSRTLPSVSLKNSSAQSFLGIQFQTKKQAPCAPLTNLKQESNVKHPKVQHRQIRFADVLAKPLSPHSEI